MNGNSFINSRTSIFIIKDYKWDYLARYEPWKDANGNRSNYTANGWRTVTIPLSMFRTGNGLGTSAGSLTDLLRNNGSGQIIIYTTNEASSPTGTGLNAAIDNIRVVRIQ